MLSAAAMFASWKSSGTRISEASDVSLIRESNVLESGGTAIRAACGSTMRLIDCQYSIPITVAASYWPRGTERIEARTISAAYPPTLRLKAITAATYGSSLRPTCPRPKKIRNSCTSSGVPRMTEM